MAHVPELPSICCHWGRGSGHGPYPRPPVALVCQQGGYRNRMPCGLDYFSLNHFPCLPSAPFNPRTLFSATGILPPTSPSLHIEAVGKRSAQSGSSFPGLATPNLPALPPLPPALHPFLAKKSLSLSGPSAPCTGDPAHSGLALPGSSCPLLLFLVLFLGGVWVIE